MNWALQELKKPDKRQFIDRYVVVAVLIAGFVIRVNAIQQNPMWFDELLEYWTARAPTSEILQTILNSSLDPPFYTLILHLWISISHNEFFLKLLSAFFSILGIAGLYSLARLFTGQIAALIAITLLTLARPDIYHAYEVNQYSLLSWLLIWSLFFLSKAFRSSRWMWWILWLATSLLAIYTHYGSLIVIFGSSAAVFLFAIYRRNWLCVRYQSVTSLGFILLLIPIITIMIPVQLENYQLLVPDRVGIEFTSASEEVGSILRKTSEILTHSVMGPISDPWPWANIPRFLVWGSISLLTIAGIVIGVKEFPLFVAGFLISWGVYIIVGRIGYYPYGGSRHALILAPYYIVLIAVAIAAMKRINRILFASVLAAVLILFAAAPPYPPEDLREVVSYWLSEKEDDQITYVYYGAVPGFRYQMEHLTNQTSEVSPNWFRDCWSGDDAAYCSEKDVIYGSWIRSKTPDERASIIMDTVSDSGDPYWIIFSHTSDAEINETVTALLVDNVVSDQFLAEGAAAYLFRMR